MYILFGSSVSARPWQRAEGGDWGSKGDPGQEPQHTTHKSPVARQTEELSDGRRQADDAEVLILDTENLLCHLVHGELRLCVK